SRDRGEDAPLAAIGAGASAYVLKPSPGSEVIAAIRNVAKGGSLSPPAMIARLVSRGKDRQHMRGSLSAREREVLQLLADGVPTRQVAHRLGISYSTVRTHVRSIRAKPGTHSPVHPVVAARAL